MQTVVGLVEEASPGEYYNALAILQDGEIVVVHRKLNLPTYGTPVIMANRYGREDESLL